jgi:hypothetical protein
MSTLDVEVNVLNDGDMSVSSINIGAGDVGGCLNRMARC